MSGARWFSAVTGSFSGVWVRIVALLQARQGLGSLEEYQREIGRLRGKVESVRAKREKEKSEFAVRHRILDQYPSDAETPVAEVDRQLANLRQIREDRLEAEEQAYKQEIRELERQAEERFGPR
ncbi:MAG: hypothetical protein ACE5JQ_03595 [Candidatus Methylomirabilales bacterium]